MHFIVWAIGLCFLVEVVVSTDTIKPPSEDEFKKFDPVEEARQPTISIVGGTPAAAGEFPFLVIMRYDGGLRCGGSLLGPSHVLTAAHCLYGLSVSATAKLSVTVNTLTLAPDANAVTRSVTKFILHPNYNSRTYNNDVAIMVLSSPISNVGLVSLPAQTTTTTTTTLPTTRRTKRPLFPIQFPFFPLQYPFFPLQTTRRASTMKTTIKVVTVNTTRSPVEMSTTMRPAERATTNHTIETTAERTTVETTRIPTILRASDYANMEAVIAGWGTTTSGGSISQVLLKATVTVLDNAICVQQYGSSSFLGGSMLCAAAPGKDTCQGDSGGPLLVDGVQVGITSWGRGCALPNYAGVYARVPTYVDWILATQASNPAPVL